MLIRIFISIIFLGLSSLSFADTIKGEEKAVLTYAPEVPPPITRTHSTKVIVNLETKEVEAQLTDGVKYVFWTFGGRVPGKFIRVREGDLVEFHLSNHPSNKMPHNIDLHAVTGPGGGAASSFAAPGHTATFSFKAINPGLYVYHCATAPVGMHIANGMYGLILVQPKEGLPKVDKEFYVMQSDFYTKGAYGKPGKQPFSMEKALDERPDYVVFNGSVGSLTGDKALQAKVGETVRIYFGDGGPNITSNFHVIGEIFDKVYPEGGMKFNTNVQTTVVPPGGSAIVDFKLEVPGTYILVDHAIFRTFNKGALGMLKVAGDENKEIYSGKISDEIYQPEGSGIQTIDASKAPPAPVAKSKTERIALGKNIYTQNCTACHQVDGKGIAMAFPPLAKSDYLNGDKTRVIRAVTKGLTGEVVVNGSKYNGVMPAWTSLSDEEVANVLTYVYSMWGNSGKEIKPEDVKNVRQGK